MKLINEIKKELKELSKSLLKDFITEPEFKEKNERDEFLIFEEGKGTLIFELEESEETNENIEDIVNLLKTGQYDRAIEKIRELKAQKGYGL